MMSGLVAEIRSWLMSFKAGGKEVVRQVIQLVGEPCQSPSIFMQHGFFGSVHYCLLINCREVIINRTEAMSLCVKMSPKEMLVREMKRFKNILVCNIL